MINISIWRLNHAGWQSNLMAAVLAERWRLIVHKWQFIFLLTALIYRWNKKKNATGQCRQCRDEHVQVRMSCLWVLITLREAQMLQSKVHEALFNALSNHNTSINHIFRLNYCIAICIRSSDRSEVSWYALFQPNQKLLVLFLTNCSIWSHR